MGLSGRNGVVDGSYGEEMGRKGFLMRCLLHREVFSGIIMGCVQ